MTNNKTIKNSNTSIQDDMSILRTVGNTPLLKLRTLTAELPRNVEVYAKAEWFNPSGSVKARPALRIMIDALSTGKILPGMHLLDSTSGNMGIAYAIMGNYLDIPVTLAMPSNASPERSKILRALGAEIIFTDPLEGTDGAIDTARRLAEEQPNKYFYANQFDNPSNWQAHYQTTGPEIVEQTSGKITHFVAGLGTSGTLTGTARYLRDNDFEVEVIGVQPDSPLHGLEGLKHLQTAYPPKIYDPTLSNRMMAVSTEDAYKMLGRLARREGLFVGVSSGAACVAALQVASELTEGVLVTIFPDSGMKYLSNENIWENSDVT